MASVQKFHDSTMQIVLGHNGRAFEHTSNGEIDSARTSENYSLTPDHDGLTPFEYYQRRKTEVFIFDRSRKDVNYAFGWVISLPGEIVTPEAERQFFECASQFMLERYGSENALDITVHKDETRPHLHAVFIPVVQNNLQSADHPEAEKLSCKEVINRAELRTFHRDLQQYLDDHGVAGQVINGATAGGNRTVAELKREAKELRAEVERLREVEKNYSDLIQERTLQHEQGRWGRRETSIERDRF